MLAGQLRPGNTHPGSGAGPFLKECLDALGELARSRLIVRADAAWCSEAVFSRLEAYGASYIVVARATQAVKRKLAAKARWRPLDGSIQVGSFHLALEGWSRTRRIVAVRTLVAEGESPQGKLFDTSGYTYQLLATDLAHPPERVWRLYRGRANAENVIKELKDGFNLDKPPTLSWRANEAYLQLCLLAYNLYVGYLREVYAPSRRVHQTVQTMRLIRHVAGRWVKRARRWAVVVSPAAGIAARRRVLSLLKASTVDVHSPTAGPTVPEIGLNTPALAIKSQSGFISDPPLSLSIVPGTAPEPEVAGRDAGVRGDPATRF